jgi:hypothetical protein
MTNGRNTGLRDEHYDLVSVLYHATHGAWNYDEYISDAEAAGDKELAEFLGDAKERNRELAQRAKDLLAKRIG